MADEMNPGSERGQGRSGADQWEEGSPQAKSSLLAPGREVGGERGLLSPGG